MLKKNKKVAVNVGISSFNALISAVYPFLTFTYISRILQVDNIGAINFCSSIINYFTLIAAFGIGTFAIRNGSQIKNDISKLSQFSSQLFTINLWTTLIAYFLLILLVFSSAKINSYLNIIIIQSIILLVYPLGLEWLYSILEDFSYITVRNFVIKTISLFFIFLFVKTDKDIFIYLWIVTISSVFSNIVNYFHARKYVKLRIVKNTGWKEYKGNIIIFFVNNIASVIYLSSDKTMLGIMCGDAEVGLYTVAANIYAIVKQVVNAAINATIPRMANYASNDMKKLKKLASMIISYVIIATVPMSSGIIILRKEIILLISSKDYLSSGFALILLTPALIFSTLANVFAYGILVSLKKENIVAVSTFVSAVINLGLNFLLLPIMEESGAALTTSISELLMLFICYLSSRKYIRGVNWKKTVVNAIIASGIMFLGGIAIYDTVSEFNLIARIMLVTLPCIIIYYIILFFIRDPSIMELNIYLKNNIHNRIRKRLEGN